MSGLVSDWRECFVSVGKRPPRVSGGAWIWADQGLRSPSGGSVRRADPGLHFLLPEQHRPSGTNPFLDPDAL